jgi:hypothetical protein
MDMHATKTWGCINHRCINSYNSPKPKNEHSSVAVSLYAVIRTGSTKRVCTESVCIRFGRYWCVRSWIHKGLEFKRSGCKGSKFRRSGLKRRLSSVFGYSVPVVQRKTYTDRQSRQAYSDVDNLAWFFSYKHPEQFSHKIIKINTSLLN